MRLAFSFLYREPYILQEQARCINPLPGKKHDVGVWIKKRRASGVRSLRPIQIWSPPFSLPLRCADMDARMHFTLNFQGWGINEGEKRQNTVALATKLFRHWIVLNVACAVRVPLPLKKNKENVPLSKGWLSYVTNFTGAPSEAIICFTNNIKRCGWRRKNGRFETHPRIEIATCFFPNFFCNLLICIVLVGSRWIKERHKRTTGRSRKDDGQK